jgi:Herpesviridae UL52/UL70 DNA primase
MSCPIPTTATTIEESEGGVFKTAAAVAEKLESVVEALSSTCSSSPPRRHWRQAASARGGSSSSHNDKENNTATAAIVGTPTTTTTTPSKSRSHSHRSTSSNWGLWRRSTDDNDSSITTTNRNSTRRRSFGVSPRAFHAAAAPVPVPAPAAAHGASSSSPFAATVTASRDHSLFPTTTTTTTATTKAGQESVLQLHAMVQSNLIQQGKRNVMERQKLKRSAFYQVTCLKTWPLQERALTHLQQLLDQHLHQPKNNTNAATRTSPTNSAAAAGITPTTIQEGEEEEISGNGRHRLNLSTPTAAESATAVAAYHACGTLSASSLSSASSSSSSAFTMENNEPKRLLRDVCLSPAKSRLKFPLQQEFLQQQALVKVSPSTQSKERADAVDVDAAAFGPALWCMEPRLFSVEKSTNGKRKYVVGHAGRFFDYYWRKMNRHSRHYYELIRQDTPCRLYLDLEFQKNVNPDITDDVAEAFLSQLLSSLSRQLQESFPLQFGKGRTGGGGEGEALVLDRTHVVDLDSSTEKKFSRHWIVHLPGGYLFAHTTALGRFMHEWVGNILFAAQQSAQGATSDESNKYSVLFEHLFVNPPPSSSSSSSKLATGVSASGHSLTNNKTCLIDLGVYTRNRLFRLLGSTKFGKPPSAALRIADANEFPFPEGFGNESFYLPAMTEHQTHEQQQQDPLLLSSSQESKQSNVTTDDTVEVAVEKFSAAIDWTTHAEALAQTLVVPLNATKIDFPILPFDNTETAANATVSGTAKAGSHTKTTCSIPSSSSFPSFGRSPFPMVDDFVLQTLATRGTGGESGGIVQGSIRCWSLDCHPDTGVPLYLTFQMSRNRYCECVRRAHKSNNIAWRVDLVLMQAVQTCHDPECRALQFRGTPVPLPQHVPHQIRQHQQHLESAATTASGSTKIDDCDDDDGFEGVGDDVVLKALAAMNLDEIESRVLAVSEHCGGAEVPPAAAKRQQSPKPSNDKDVDDFDDDDFPDDALAEAILSNPELFP